MKTISSNNARLLFVIDNDFGALGLVLYFLFRQPISTRATLLMPDWLYQKQAKNLSVKSYPYRSRQDILKIVEKESPDIVFLFSGYLLASVLPNIREFENLLHDLQMCKCRLVTSDPYIGTFRSFDNFPKQKDRLAKLIGRVSEFIRKRRGLRTVRRISYCLQDIKHLHAVPSPKAEWNKTDNISFYNENYIRSKKELDELAASISNNPNSDNRQPQWLFVLARFDLDYQIEKHGKDAFIALVIAKLKQALVNEKHPTLIAPRELIDALIILLPNQTSITLLAECAFDEFERRLLSAEVVFYWQVFSTSTFLRLLHGQPVFCFDLGHSAHLNKLFHKACMACYYLGKSPIMLDIHEDLDSAYLAQFTDEFQSTADFFRHTFSTLSSPSELVDQLLYNTH